MENQVRFHSLASGLESLKANRQGRLSSMYPRGKTSRRPGGELHKLRRTLWNALAAMLFLTVVSIAGGMEIPSPWEGPASGVVARNGESHRNPRGARGSVPAFYVSPSGLDTNSGSITRPWATIAHAANNVGPGSVVHVAPGTYVGPISSRTSGTAAARIRFVSDLPWGAVIQIRAPASFAWVNSGAFVDIEGFEVQGPAANGIYNTGSYARIVNNYVHHLSPTCDGNGGSGINIAGGGLGSVVASNVVHDVRMTSYCGKSHGVGIYIQAAATVIYNNLVYRSGNEGIQMWHGATAGTIANNTVFHNGRAGILVGCGDGGCAFPGPGKNDDTIVVNNISIANEYGIREYGSTGTHNVYRNNLIYMNGKNLELQNGNTAVGTIESDPAAVFTEWKADGSGDYRPRPGGPAFHRGTADGLPADLLSARASQDPIDIGSDLPGISYQTKRAK